MGVSHDSSHGAARRRVGAAAYQYVRDWLWLGRGLQPFLCPVLEPHRFRCWTVAGPEVPDEQLARFGAAVPVFSGEVASVVADELARIMAGCDDRVLLAPDPMGNPGDAFLERAHTPYLIVDDEIYYVGSPADAAVLARVWRAGASAAGQMAVITKEGVDTSTGRLDLNRAAHATVALAPVSPIQHFGCVVGAPRRDRAPHHWREARSGSRLFL